VPHQAASVPAKIGRRTPSATVRTNQVRRRGEIPSERGARTRLQIADAAICLLTEMNGPPTAHDVAARAGVTPRLLFHHFNDLDALYRFVSAIQFERYRRDIPEVPSDLPLDQRIERTVQKRSELYQSMGHLGWNAALLSTRHQSVAESLVETHAMLKSRLERTFAPELQAAGRGRRELMTAIDAAVSWHVWHYVRDVSGLPVVAARRVMSRMLRAAFAPELLPAHVA